MIPQITVQLYSVRDQAAAELAALRADIAQLRSELDALHQASAKPVA